MNKKSLAKIAKYFCTLLFVVTLLLVSSALQMMAPQAETTLPTLTSLTKIAKVTKTAKAMETVKAAKPALPTELKLPQPKNADQFSYFSDTFIPKIFGLFMIGAGVFGLIFVLIGGVEFLISYGNEQMLETAKKTVQYAVIGVIVALLSYTIVLIINNMAEYFT